MNEEIEKASLEATVIELARSLAESRHMHRVSLHNYELALAAERESIKERATLLEEIDRLNAQVSGLEAQREEDKDLTYIARTQRDCILFAATHLDEVIAEAQRRFGGDDGVFTSAGFSNAARDLSGTSALLDGKWVGTLLESRCVCLQGGSHYRPRDRNDTEPPPPSPDR